jgi:hypothetical protein
MRSKPHIQALEDTRGEVRLLLGKGLQGNEVRVSYVGGRRSAPALERPVSHRTMLASPFVHPVKLVVHLFEIKRNVLNDFLSSLTCCQFSHRPSSEAIWELFVDL